MITQEMIDKKTDELELMPMSQYLKLMAKALLTIESLSQKQRESDEEAFIQYMTETHGKHFATFQYSSGAMFGSWLASRKRE